MVTTARLNVETKNQGDTHDLTSEVAQAVRRSGFQCGTATVFVVGSTAAITTIEFEAGAIADFNGLLSRLAPYHKDYAHHHRWGDDNGSSHVRAALLGPSVTIPFERGELALGTWQQIVLVECDTGGRSRQVIVTTIGE